MKPTSPLALAVVLLTSPAIAEQSLICAADRAVGFRYANGIWSNANFNVSGETFVVSALPGDNEPTSLIRYDIKKLGQKTVYVSCVRFRTDNVLNPVAYCGEVANVQVTINFDSMRYQELYSHGFLDALDDGQNTPSLTIGRCSEITN